jgi:hypothetical protein
MNDAERSALIRMGWDIHAVVEDSYRRHSATSGGDPAAWLDKQRLLLADMAIHLLQTALKPGDIELGQLRNNLHAILTISDRFLPHAGLQDATAHLHDDRRPGPPHE